MFGNKKRAKLYSQGAQTEGLVEHRSDTTEGINYRVTIRVKFPDGSTTELKKWLDWHDVGQLYQGSIVPVRYDPSDHSKVELDVPALAERHARADAAGNAQLDAQFARLGEPDSGTGGGPAVQALAGLGDLGDLKAQLLQTAAENPASVLDLSSGSPGRSAPDPEDRLTKLADLKERGVLSDEEFAAEKAKILGES
ncbi:MAG TPA: SHOCT domain-containing protein [Solirubrobacteraceae bacterium]